ncbi:PEP-CTERM sorting domain-containing protein [Tychonema sp. LEGE 07199]|uniref:PEP-CTERM sorting domain-containing protein n=1 Tax=unclassified Tychonema TaxID=2642144 RepID=UPI001881CD88|nr:MULTISPECIES: PEP-CTERM sorting domain-containing protein [unclassified Tychonema]MBE9119375.1 PEP-CTERM sorting domain-containing protein [Tychonema sp. LEGE 07199]MBE9130538.1 PEP-CTERM sorting domain-containing protein [Tychonema sp. LEGE 07196]
MIYDAGDRACVYFVIDSALRLLLYVVDTAAEPVPEPLTVGGTALGLAGLSWLKHKKKTAV